MLFDPLRVAPLCNPPAISAGRAGVPPRATERGRRPTRSARPRNRRSPSCDLRRREQDILSAWRFRSGEKDAGQRLSTQYQRLTPPPSQHRKEGLDVSEERAPPVERGFNTHGGGFAKRPEFRKLAARVYVQQSVLLSYAVAACSRVRHILCVGRGFCSRGRSRTCGSPQYELAAFRFGIMQPRMGD